MAPVNLFKVYLQSCFYADKIDPDSGKSLHLENNQV